jgi:hypothetical protein
MDGIGYKLALPLARYNKLSRISASWSSTSTRWPRPQPASALR